MPGIKGLQVTKRELKNVETGIDLSVPSYEDASSPKKVEFYHVVVISRLVNFKQGQHSPEDIIQFMVQRKYSDFEQLQENLLQNHPELTLPPLPNWNVWFLNEDDLEDRRVSFDCLLKKLAKDTYFATCPPLFDFLGIELLADRKYYREREKYLESKKKEQKEKDTEEAPDLFGDDTQPNDELFSPSPPPTASESLFHGGDRKATAAFKMPEDSTDSLLALDDTTEHTNKIGETIPVEDNSDLLRVEESLDDLLKLTTKTTKQKAPNKILSAHKPSGYRSKQIDEPQQKTAVNEMDTADIARYIEQEHNADSDVDLFS